MIDFTYVAWGSGEIVARAFSALALISMSAELSGALAVAALAALLMGSASGALSGNFQVLFMPMRLLIAAVVATGVLLAPATVIVEDRLDGQDILWSGHGPGIRGPAVVSSVPVGVAMPAAVASQMGVALTELFETAMGLVDESEQLSSAGLWLDARALQEMVAGRGELVDAELPHDLVLFVENCTYFDVISGRASARDLLRNPVRETLQLTAGGHTSVHAGSRGQGSLQPVTCVQAWHGNGDPDPDTGIAGLDVRLQAEGSIRQFQACQALRGTGLALGAAERAQAQAAAENPELHGTGCGAEVFAHALQAFGYGASVAEAFADTVAAELLRDYVHMAAGLQPETVAFGKFSARRQRDAAYVIAGELAATALPALRGLLEVAMIVLMPVLLICGILMFEQIGKYLKNGILMLLWLHMWPPVIAIINAVGTWLQVIAVNEQAILSRGLLAAGSIGPLQDELAVQLALSRYLLVITPMLAYALVKSGEISGAMLAGKLMMPGEQAATAAGSSAALNNWTTDQVNLAPRTQLGAAVAQIRDPYGGMATHYEHASLQSLPGNEPSYLQARQAQTVAQEIRRSSTEAQTAARESSERYSQGVEAAYEQALGAEGREVIASLRASGVRDSTSFRALESASESAQTATEEAQSRTDDQAVAGHFKVSLGANSDWIPLVDMAGAASEETRSAIETSFRDSASVRNDESTAALREVGQALERSGHAEMTFSASRITSEQFRSGLRETERHEQTLQAAESRAHTLAAASQASSQSYLAAVHDLLKDPRAFELLASYHRLRSEDGLEHSHAWAEAQRQSGYRLDVDALAERVIAQVPAPDDRGLPVPAGQGQVQDAHAANRLRLQADTPPAAPALPEIAGAERTIDEHRQELQDRQLQEPSPVVGRERQADAQSAAEGGHEPAQHMVIQAAERFAGAIEHSGKYLPEWMRGNDEADSGAEVSKDKQ